MSITNELRKYADELETAASRKSEHGFSPAAMKLTAIADRIDAEHESACEEAHSKGMKSIWLPDPTEYIKLPVDADGEYIHIGDKVTLYGRCVYEVDGIHFYKNNVSLSYKGESGCGCDSANNFRHYHAPTVEDVLTELTDEVWNRHCVGGTASDSGIRELVAEYAAKLRLAGDAE